MGGVVIRSLLRVGISRFNFYRRRFLELSIELVDVSFDPSMETEAGEVETTDQCCSVRLCPHEGSGSRTDRGGIKAMRERGLVNIGQVDDTISFYRPQFRESFHASAN